MSDEAAFLNAILANPEDDAPRLVYADWLEERGDPATEPREPPADAGPDIVRPFRSDPFAGANANEFRSRNRAKSA
jgi:uncharacterized protein (TIGR02996 family)